jgi:uncharacterized membrane protein
MTESFFRDQTDHETTTPTETETSLIPMADTTTTSDADQSTVEEERIAAVLSYIPILCFIPLINIHWKESKEARFHARQGIVLFLVELVAVLMLVDDLARFVFRAVLVAAAALAVAGVYFALQGKRYRLPLISEFADRMKL